MTLIPKHPPIRSSKNTSSAKGQPCTLRFLGVCGDDENHEATVYCHVHDASFGMRMKADDSFGIDGCYWCHNFLDHGWVGKISQTIRLKHIIRGLQETLRNRIERGIIILKQDKPKVRKIAQRKPKGQRTSIQPRKNAWPPRGSQKIARRSGLKRERV